MKFISCAAAALTVGICATSVPASATITFESDPILFWNQVLLDQAVTSAPFRTRAYAITNIAMHDAVNAALGGPNHGYLSGVTASGGDSRAAASAAAHRVLTELFPDPARVAVFNNALAASLTRADPATLAAGVATGEAYAAAILGLRASDGSGASVPYMTTGLPGDWRPVPGGGAYAFAQWGGVDPFLMSRGDQFRPGAPPALNSDEYRDAYNDVKLIGSSMSELNGDRTADETHSALFWSGANGSEWLRIGLLIAEDESLSTLEFARAFALISTTAADALISGLDSKLEYRLWRPATAIREGDADGNDDTDGDPDWNSLFTAPPYPSYQGNLATLAGAGSTVLLSIFGDGEGFCFTSTMRYDCFGSIAEAAFEAGRSRELGGIHFSFDTATGLEAGRQIGQLALTRNAFQPVPEPGTWAMMIAGFGLAGAAIRRRAVPKYAVA